MGTNLATPLLTDPQIARRVLAHIDAGTTDEGEDWQEPVDHYLDPGRFDAERELLRSLPSVFAPSVAVARPGEYVTRTVLGVSLLALRDRSGTVRTFRNACRHRGVPVAEGSGCARSLVCPYHGWTYGLDGSLRHLPHGEAFPGLDVASHGLVEVDSAEVDRLVLVGPLDGSPGDFGALTSRRPWRHLLDSATRVVTSSVPKPINWKVLVEQFLEGHHIRTTHRDTFFPLQYDDLNIVEPFGRNVRVTYPYRNIERLRHRPETDWTVRERVTFVYHLFPNAMVATFPEQITVIVIDPVDVGRSELTTYTTARADREPPPTAPRDRPDADADVPLLVRGALEDDAMSRGVQAGLATGANAVLEFGRHESAIGHFHRQLTELLATRLPSTGTARR